VFEQAGMKVMTKNIEGKVVVITGASSGLGEPTASTYPRRAESSCWSPARRSH
jgi:NADP-dependent 3-hydroxy acid dehydrogenase YdfG